MKTKTFSVLSKVYRYKMKSSLKMSSIVNQGKWMRSKMIVTKIGNLSISLTMIKRQNRRQRESRCKWGKRMSWSLKIRFSMQLKKCCVRNLESTKVWKVSRAVSGTSYRTYPLSTIEYSSSRTTTKLIMPLWRITSQEDSLIQDFTSK